MDIAGKRIQDNSIFFIAEAGVNHNGDMDLARKLIDEAATAGADAVKFQAYDAEKLVAEDGPKAAYQEEQTNHDSQLEMLREYELTRDQHRELMQYSEKVGIIYLATPFDRENAEFLNDEGVQAIKLGSGELNNWPLLETVAEFDQPSIVSTGMGTMSEVVDAYKIFETADAGDNVIFLHCTSSYPTAIEHVNFRAMETMQTALPTPIGYSDHTTAVETPAMAVAAGAVIVEKHLTLNRSMEGPDHSASMEPEDIDTAISLAQKSAKMRGRPEKTVTKPETDVQYIARKSLHVNTNLNEGDILTKDNVAIKRPANGLSPTLYNSVIGERVTRKLQPDEAIGPDDIAVDVPANNSYK